MGTFIKAAFAALLKKPSAGALVLGAALLVFYCLVYFGPDPIARLVPLNRPPLSDTVFLGGDEWEYQSMAVNFALGHGLKFGQIEPYETYRFDPASDPQLRRRFEEGGRNGGKWDFYRTPGFPVFLGLVYKAFGVSPVAARKAQLMLVLLTAALMPLAGVLYFGGGAGLWGGALGSFALVNGYAYYALHILTEPLIVFSLMALALVYAWWERAKSRAASVALGAALGAALLVKGVFIFIPPLLFGWLAWLAVKGKVKPGAIALMCSTLLVILLSWSAYVYSKTGEKMFISSQGGGLALDCNNEYALEDAGWHPEYKDIPGSFYNRPDIAPLPDSMKVLSFFRAYAGELPAFMAAKIDGSFRYMGLLKSLWIIILLSVLGQAAAGRFKHSAWPAAVFAAAAVAPLFAGALRPVSATLILCAAAIAAIARGPAKFAAGTRFPVFFFIIFLNTLFTAVMFLAFPRYAGIADWVFILSAFALALQSAQAAARIWAPPAPTDANRGDFS